MLLVKDGELVKTVRFSSPRYLGDPINAVRIFNDKEVDEIVVLDISATVMRRPPNWRFIEEFTSECFMPVCYGGGISAIAEIERILKVGVEKVALNSSTFTTPGLIGEAAREFGSQSIAVSIDVKKDRLGRFRVVHTCNGLRMTDHEPHTYAARMQELGAGEIFLNSVDRDGTASGYEVDLIRQVSSAVTVPVVVCGGAATVSDFSDAVECGASAVAAGSMFVFFGRYRAVLITYPSAAALASALP